MEVKSNDFVEIEYDMYANGKLVQTTDKKKAESAGMKVDEVLSSQILIIGRSVILKALDDDIIEKQSLKEEHLELEPEKAYGIRKKDMLKVLPKSAFEEHKTRPLVGVVYDFNGMYGTVKSVIGGRILVDFNSPLAGKKISIDYKVLSKVDNIAKKIEVVNTIFLTLPTDSFNVKIDENNDKQIILSIPEQLVQMKDLFMKSYEEIIPDFKDYTLKIEKFKNQQKHE